MARIAAIGTGSVGLYFAGSLAAEGHDVVCCVRRAFDRYIIESDTAPLDMPAIVDTDPAALDGEFDLVLFGVKAHQTDGASAWLRAATASGRPPVVVLQNGIEHERVAPYIGDSAIIPAVVRCGAELVDPGHIRHTAAGSITIAAEPYGAAVAAIFEGSAAGVRLSDDIVTDQWTKLASNTIANGLCALTDQPIGVVEHPLLRSIAVDLARETAAVAAADGANVDAQRFEAIIDRMAGLDGLPSTLQDVRAGRPTEHDAIHGAVIRRAERYGINVPTVRVVHALLDAHSVNAVD